MSSSGREDHEALVPVAREEAYREGYQMGWADAARQSAQAGQQIIEIRRRRSVFARLRRVVVGVVLLAMFLIVLETVVEQFLAAR